MTCLGDPESLVLFSVAGRGTAMPAQPCRHLLFWGMPVREWKKKNYCIHRYQTVETEEWEVTAELAVWQVSFWILRKQGVYLGSELIRTAIIYQSEQVVICTVK